MKNLLLISTSRTWGTGYLDHCEEAVREHFEGCGSVLFLPFALHDQDGYADLAVERFRRMGIGLSSIHRAEQPWRAVQEAEGIFVGGGNTFRLLKTLYDQDLLGPIRLRVREGVPYMGSSAGSNVACPTIQTTNDMPIVYPPSFRALGLVPFQVNPHYLDPDPDSHHMGETRETRIREYHEENKTSVVGLREGAMLRCREGQVHLLGETGARLFRRGREPEEIQPGTELGALLE